MCLCVYLCVCVSGSVQSVQVFVWAYRLVFMMRTYIFRDVLERLLDTNDDHYTTMNTHRSECVCVCVCMWMLADICDIKVIHTHTSVYRHCRVDDRQRWKQHARDAELLTAATRVSAIKCSDIQSSIFVCVVVRVYEIMYTQYTYIVCLCAFMLMCKKSIYIIGVPHYTRLWCGESLWCVRTHRAFISTRK